MVKRLACLFVALASLWGCVVAVDAPAGIPADPAVQEAPAGIPAEVPQEVPTDAAPQETPAPQPSMNQFEIYVEGRNVPDAYSILDQGTTYVSVFHVARALCAGVSIAWENGSTLVRGEGFEMTLRPDQPYLVCNGRYLYLPGCPRIHPTTGDMLIPVRVLAKALGAQFTWDSTGVFLTPGVPLESGDTFYDAQDVDLIARVIRHESGNQPLAGQIAVGNVILNRTTRRGFGGPTVQGVLSAPNQFTGATRYDPTPGTIIAAKLALDGAVTAPGACWFNRAGLKTSWAAKHKTLVVTIGSHDFYG